MAISVFPAPETGGATDTAFAAEIPLLQTTYEHVNNFGPGVYQVDIVPSTTNANLVFVNQNSILLNTVTTSGTVSFVLSSEATKVYITTKSGGTVNAIVTITKNAASLIPDNIGNGTVDTINTTGTYNQTGLLNILAFGGGAAGVMGNICNQGGDGGEAGAVSMGLFYVNSSTTVTVGAKGTANNSANGSRVAPTNSSFGNLINSSSSNFFNTGTAGGAGGYNGGGGGGAANFTFTSFNGNSTSGGGGGGAGASITATRNGGIGAGSGIGTGGNGGTTSGSSRQNGTVTVNPNAGTGKASGGGGGGSPGTDVSANQTGRFGRDGTDGVVYVLRGF